MKSYITELKQKLVSEFEGKTLSLHEPLIEHVDEEAVIDCLRSGFVSSVGEYVSRFESIVADYCNAGHGVATVNGTTGLMISLVSLCLEPDCEVFVPAISFVATANAVLMANMVPHFVDIEPTHIGIDIAKLESYVKQELEFRDKGLFNPKTGRYVCAIVAMHTFGNPSDLNLIVDFAKRYKLKLVEDAAESLGSRYDDRQTGLFGDVGVLSFNGNKIITTGGGGMIITDDEVIAAKAKHLSTTAKVKYDNEFFHDRLGYNARLPNINAALGCSQMSKLPSYLERKSRLHEVYAAMFSSLEEVNLYSAPAICRSNHWLNAIIVPPEDRKDIMECLADVRIEVRPVWYPLNALPHLKNFPASNCDYAEEFHRSVLTIPSSAFLLQ